MKITNVTITGADDAVNPAELSQISRAWKFVEWGILCSQSREGTKRYPMRDWIRSLDADLPLSAHVCGRYMRDLKSGIRTWHADYGSKLWRFRRAQINLGNEPVDGQELVHLEALIAKNPPDVMTWIIPSTVGNPGVGAHLQSFGRVQVLLDHSGGEGKSNPWILPPGTGTIGFAGGLNPENLEEELHKIEEIAGSRHVWIDVESGVRTDDRLDLEKVEKFLDIASRFHE